ncbi:unnamed protein product [Mycena citricolor]|uniref:Uncharacterized protein n=1 Tax=Mycena citricolor TaxID=2018698 RepID=A0AAD2HPI0_9AGAR|nr:unnamed protein product [Mycena citricolor]
MSMYPRPPTPIDRPSSPGALPSAVPSAADSYAHSQLASLLNFRPSSRDLISGIAPHVYEESGEALRRLAYRSRSRRRRRSPSPGQDCRRRTGGGGAARILEVRQSPLRVSPVLSFEDMYGKAGSQESIVLEVTEIVVPVLAAVPPPARPEQPIAEKMVSATTGKKTKRNSFRIDRVFKSVHPVSQHQLPVLKLVWQNFCSPPKITRALLVVFHSHTHSYSIPSNNVQTICKCM